MRVLILALVFVWSAAGQMSMTVGQLKQFIHSSYERKYPDKQVARYIKLSKLTEQLSDRDLLALISEAPGPETADALKQMADQSKRLAPPPAEPAEEAKPAPKPAGPPAPALKEQERIIEEAREVALSYTKKLPDFICLQYTRRLYRPHRQRRFPPVQHHRRAAQLLRAEGRLQVHLGERRFGRDSQVPRDAGRGHLERRIRLDDEGDLRAGDRGRVPLRTLGQVERARLLRVRLPRGQGEFALDDRLRARRADLPAGLLRADLRRARRAGSDPADAGGRGHSGHASRSMRRRPRWSTNTRTSPARSSCCRRARR